MFTWIAKNISLIILSLILGLVIWFAAQYTLDPNQENTTRPINVQVHGLDPNYIIVNEFPQEARVTLQAPRSIWNRIEEEPKLIQPTIDLSELGPGTHNVPINPNISRDLNPIHFISLNPEEVQIEIEQLVTKQFPIIPTIMGQPELGFEAGELTLEPENVSITGPLPIVEKVHSVHVEIDISNASENQNYSLPVELRDENGSPLEGISVTPDETEINLPITLLGGFKNVVVKVATTGQIADGYRLTNVSVSPPTVTVFSEDPRVLDRIPGFVETQPVDLTNLSDDSEASVPLKLPEGVTAVRNPSVLVQISIAAIETSETFSIPVQITGLSPEFKASISPELVDVIIAGPINILETLETEDVRAFLDLEGLPGGSVYQLPPKIDLIPEQLRVQTTLPETIEVEIVSAPTPTPAENQQTTPTPPP